MVRRSDCSPNRSAGERDAFARSVGGEAMRRVLFGLVFVAVFYAAVPAREKSTLSPVTKSFISVDSPVVTLEHVRVIDGRGEAAVADQTIVIENGAIREIGKSGSVSVPSGARVMDLTGRSVIPGLVGMHDHLFYPTASGQGPA